MKIERPSYYIKLHMAKCPRVIAINGVEIERDFSSASNYSEYPINHYIKKGNNHLEFMIGEENYMKSNTDQSSSCKVEVRVRGKVNNNSVDYKVTDIVYTPNYTDDKSELYKNSAQSGEYSFDENNKIVSVKNGGDFSTDDVKLGKIYFPGVGENFRREFTAQVPFPEWSFFSGEKITDHPIDSDSYHKLNDQIMPLVRKVWDLFESKNIDQILPHFESRSAEIDQAFYKSPGTTQNELRRSIENVFSEDYPLDRRSDDKMQLIVSYGGELVTIVNAGTRAGTVLYLDDETDSLTFYTIYWMKKDGKWIIAR